MGIIIRVAAYLFYELSDINTYLTRNKTPPLISPFHESSSLAF